MAGRHENHDVHRNVLADHVHDVEPADLSLAKARDFAGGTYASDFCDECGCRLARACIQWSDWVLRRTETVRFSDDRCANRIISIDLLVREEAPLYRAPGGKPFWLVPVSIMRRKTLVNFYLRDEDGNDIPLPGLRLVQHLDESVLRSVALRELQHDLQQEAQAFIHDVISGSPDQVEYRMGQLREAAAPRDIMRLRDINGIFIRMVQRMAYSCTLYAFIEADTSRRHRVLRMSVEEPLDISHEPEEPELSLADPDPARSLRPRAKGGAIRRFKWQLHALAAAMGWTTTKVRFRVPAAENATGFHFEIQAPQGVDIVEASILAAVPETIGGEPEPLRPWQYDHIRRRLPTVGLHVASVPNGSFSTAQVDFQVSIRGWYATMLLSCWATFLLLIALALHVHTARVQTTSTTDVVVFLAGVAAAVATLVAQGEFSGMAGRLLVMPRMLAAFEAGLLLIAATLFLFVGPNENRRRPWELVVLCVVAGLITLIVSASWLLARSRLSVRHESASPREMAPGLKRASRNPVSFWDAVQLYGYRLPAIRVDSAEAWHYHFQWTPEIEANATRLLSPGVLPGPPAVLAPSPVDVTSTVL
ncbi:MAG: hypothetical protein ABSA93_04905, partial [Streptosporangiaceae bacterium]